MKEITIDDFINNHAKAINSIVFDLDGIVKSRNIPTNEVNDFSFFYTKDNNILVQYTLHRFSVDTVISKILMLETLNLNHVKQDEANKIFFLINDIKSLIKTDKYVNSDFEGKFLPKLAHKYIELIEKSENIRLLSKLTVSDDVSFNVENLKKQFDESKKDYDTMLQKGTTVVQNCEKLTSELKNEFQNLGIGIYGKAFSEEAEKYETQSWIFLVVTAVFAVGIGLFSWFLLSEVIHTQYMDVSNAISWQGMIYRLIIFSTLSYLLVFCAKNYSNMKHNATVNKHRQNALATFTAFTETQQNPDVREKITLLAAYCIFGHQTTGFLKGNKDDDNIINIWSIIESVIAKRTPNTKGD